MNKQIKKLITKTDHSIGWSLPKEDEKWCEKFAELLVKECAKIADDGYGSDHFGNGIAGYQLLQHFGIVEDE